MTATDYWGGAAAAPLGSVPGALDPAAAPDYWGAGPAGSLQSTLGSKPSGGGTGWLGSITNPFGIITGAKGLATGIAKGLATPIVYGAEALGSTLGDIGSAATGGSPDWGAPLTDIRKAGQGIGDWA